MGLHDTGEPSESEWGLLPHRGHATSRPMCGLGSEGRRNANTVLALLLFAYILNFLDRQILGILGPAIMADLNLTDTEFGAVGGLAFAMLYSLLGVPLAFLADRTSRSGVVTTALTVWS